MGEKSESWRGEPEKREEREGRRGGLNIARGTSSVLPALQAEVCLAKKSDLPPSLFALHPDEQIILPHGCLEPDEREDDLASQRWKEPVVGQRHRESA